MMVEAPAASDTGDHAGGADRARPDPDLDRIGPGIDQRPRRFIGRDIAGNDLGRIAELLHPLNRAGNILVVAVGGIDDHHVAFGREQRLGPFKALVAHGGGGSDAQAPGRVLGRVGIGDRLFHVLDRDQAGAVEILIHHQQLFDPALVQQALGFFLADAGAHGGEILVRHQLAHGLHGIVGKAYIAVGQDADQPATGLDHRDAGDAVGFHQRAGLTQGGVGADRDRVDHHAAFKALHGANRGNLFFHGQVAVEHADPPELGHDDRHVGLCHGIHRGGDHRNVEPDLRGQPRARIGHRGQDIGFGRTQQHVVEGKAERYVHGCHFASGCGDSWRPM